MMTPVCPWLLNMINGFVALLSSGPRGFKRYRSYIYYYYKEEDIVVSLPVSRFEFAAE